MPSCVDCMHISGTPARLVCTKPGGLSAPGVSTVCPLFVRAGSDPLTPAERAELAAFEARHPLALMDAAQVARWAELRKKAGLR